MKHKRIIVVCGHYGCGKTNLSINLAVDLRKSGECVTLVDMDLVNPYFRSSDYTQTLTGQGIHVIAPVYAGTTLDLPALLPEVAAVFESEDTVIFDVGGDDAGATVMGRYFRNFADADYEMLYVINRYRALTQTAEEAAEILREIEAVSRLKATAVVNNSHLKQFTTAQTVLNAMSFADETARLLGLPLAFTTVPRNLAGELNIENAYPVDVYVRTPWETD